ncbi:hypothetical protein N8K70_03600 [Microbacterium betulae]|uniref:Uncharacterized protein n=1 Tax=Microbacterium betulae TaxID=2981139 RepID=A0AA97I5I3_9MICO|nr:hypothetical protein [Microbacterium sp. AB]WOF23776.1 hypothetical protein N8K70_03600 [Microbacterium sp. AB]
MTAPVLVPRNSPAGVVATWAFGAVVAIAIGLFVPIGDRFGWLAVGAGASLLVGFALDLRLGRPDGFIFRVAASTVGAVAVMGLISVTFALAAIAPA